MECGGLTPLWISSACDPANALRHSKLKAASSRSTPKRISMAGEYWLAMRADGFPGTDGKASDPWDVSSPSLFNAIMNEIATRNPQGQVCVHIGPGIFQAKRIDLMICALPATTGVNKSVVIVETS